MPVVRMPNGDQVRFPDTMSREEIRAKILQKFPQADPDRGVLQKASEFGTGAQRGVLGDMLGITKFLPGDYLPGLPESAVQARRGARQEAQQFADAPSASGYETAGKIFGREAPFAVLPGGGRVAAWGAEKAMGAVTPLGFLAFMHSFPHIAIPMLLARPNLYSSLQGLAMRAAPYVGRGVGALTGLAEKIGGAEAVNAYGRDDETQTPAAPSSPAPSTPEVPGPTPTPGTARPVARSDAAADYPTANRSGRGDRLPLYGSPTN